MKTFDDFVLDMKKDKALIDKCRVALDKGEIQVHDDTPASLIRFGKVNGYEMTEDDFVSYLGHMEPLSPEELSQVTAGVSNRMELTPTILFLRQFEVLAFLYGEH